MAAPTRAQLVAYARKAAIANGVDPDIFERQIQQESNFSPTAHNASGASGIAQLMPQFYPNVDASDPYASLDAAAQTMGANLKRNGGDYAKALAAYNAGQGNVDKYGGIPPFAETQTYVKTILGGQGGKTMGQMQDDPTALDDILAAAANGADTTGGYVPDGNVGTVASNAPAADPTSPANQMNGNDILQLIIDKLGPPISTAPINPTTKTTGGVFGPTTSPNKQPTYRYTWANGKTLDIAALDTGPVVKGGTALAVLASGTSATVKTFPDGSLRQEDPNKPLGSSERWVKIADPPADKADPAPKTVATKAGTFQWIPGTGYSLIPGTGPANVQIHTMPDGSLQQYDPDTGQWSMIQPRYVDPDEAAYKKALTANTQANTAKTQMGMRPTAQAAIADTWATIDAIQKQIASGQMSPVEGDALMSQVHQGLTATLAGTTLFERQKQAEDTATQRAQTATSLLNQRVQSASSLGASLFSSATGHVMLPKGQATLGIDPMAIANQEVNAMGGGQATGDAAAAFLKSVLGGQGAPPPPGGPLPGQPAAAQFPTTREAVLAQYPELAASPTPGQPAGTTFVPPNYEATASDVPLTVLPPRPMSLTNQRIQAGG